MRRNSFGYICRVGGMGLAMALVIAGPAWGTSPEVPDPGASDSIAADSAEEPSNVWQTLRYRGRNWLARFSVEIEIELPGSVGQTGVRADWVAELRTSLDSIFLSDKSTRMRAYFDPITGAVHRLTQLSIGPHPDFKIYEFQPDGVTRTRSEPATGQALQLPDRWPDGRRTFHGYQAEELGCRVVSNPAALAWWLSSGPVAAEVRTKDPGVCYFLGKTLYGVAIQPLGTSVARVDYELVREGRPTRRRGRVGVERYRVISRPIAGKLDEQSVVAEIVLDSESRLPLRFFTRKGPLKIDVRLDRAVLRGPTLRVTGSREFDETG